MSEQDKAAIRTEAFDDLAAIFERDIFEGHETAAMIARNAATLIREGAGLSPYEWLLVQAGYTLEDFNQAPDACVWAAEAGK